MTIEEVKDETMYCLFAPDGVWQGMTLAPDLATCMAVIKLMHKAGYGQSYHQLMMDGYKILTVKVSITKA